MYWLYFCVPTISWNKFCIRILIDWIFLLFCRCTRGVGGLSPCHMCLLHVDCQALAFQCPMIKSEIQIIDRYEDVFNSSVGNSLARTLVKIDRLRDERRNLKALTWVEQEEPTKNNLPRSGHFALCRTRRRSELLLCKNCNLIVIFNNNTYFDEIVLDQ